MVEIISAPISNTNFKLDRDLEEDSTVTLAISPSSIYQSDENLRQVLSLLTSNLNVRKVILFLTGNLQANWLKLHYEMDEKKSLLMAKKMDEDWLYKNADIIQNWQKSSQISGKQTEIKFWEFYKTGIFKDIFYVYLEAIITFYEEKTIKGFSDNIDKLIFRTDRYKRYLEQGYASKNVEMCFRNYLLEESAMLALRMSEEEAHYEVYMGDLGSPMKAIFNYYKSQLHKGSNKLLQPVKVVNLNREA